MFGKKREKQLECPQCKAVFKDVDAERICSNCFACTGCEIYNCPACNSEVVIKPMKKANS